MSTVPVRMPQLGLPTLGSSNITKDLSSNNNNNNNSQYSGKPSKSPLSVLSQKERSISLSNDKNAFGDLKKRESNDSSFVDEIGSIQKVGFRVSANSLMRESQTVPVSSIGGYGGAGTTASTIVNHPNLQATSSMFSNNSTLMASGDLFQTRGGSSTSRSTRLKKVMVSSNNATATAPAGGAVQSIQGFSSKKIEDSLDENGSGVGVSRLIGSNELAGKTGEEQQSKKFNLTSKGWVKNDPLKTRKLQNQLEQQSRISQLGSIVPGTSTNVSEYKEIVRASMGKSKVASRQKSAKSSKKLSESENEEGNEGAAGTAAAAATSLTSNSFPATTKELFDVPQKGLIRGANGLNIKVMELWINDMLQLAKSAAGGAVTPGSPDVASTATAAGKGAAEEKDVLQQIGIDRRSLVAHGISKEKVDRLYRSLFVYSFGFFEMMEDIFGHSQKQAKIVAKVWKVFGQLLENCCRSDFQNTVQQIEKENLMVLDQLNEQIHTQTQQFEQAQVMQTTKIESLQDQINNITTEQENLKNERLKLEEDYRQTDLAFNEEVSLRLQFEHKINELHSIHRELLMKHNRLLDDFDSQKVENEMRRIDLESSLTKIEVMKIAEVTANTEIKQLNWKMAESKAICEKLTERAAQAETDLVHRSRGNDKYEGLLAEQKRINEDLEFRMKNLNERLDLAKKNEQLNLRRIDELKGEQKFYTSKFGDQSEKFAAQMTELYDLKKTIVDQKQSILMQVDQIEAIQKQCNEFENEIIQIKGEKKKVEQQYEYCTNRNELLAKDLEALQTMIKDMKFGRSELEEEYIKCKLRLNNAQDTLKAKNALCKDLEVKMEIYEQRLLKVTVEYQTYTNMTQKETEVHKQKISKLEREVKTKAHEQELDQKKIEYLNTKVDQFGVQVDNLHKEILDLTTQQREDKFLISNQTNNINQLSSVVSTEQTRNEDLLAQIAQIISTNEKLNRDNKSQMIIIRELQQTHAETIQNLSSKHKREMQQYSSIEFSIHQMQFEDLLSQFKACDDSRAKLASESIDMSTRFDNLNVAYEKTKELWSSSSAELIRANVGVAALKHNVIHLVKKMLSMEKQFSFKAKQMKEQQTEAEIQKTLIEQEMKVQKKKFEDQEVQSRDQYFVLLESKKVIDKFYDESQEEVSNLKAIIVELKATIEKLNAALGLANGSVQSQKSQTKVLEEKVQQLQETLSIQLQSNSQLQLQVSAQQLQIQQMQQQQQQLQQSHQKHSSAADDHMRDSHHTSSQIHSSVGKHNKNNSSNQSPSSLDQSMNQQKKRELDIRRVSESEKSGSKEEIAGSKSKNEGYDASSSAASNNRENSKPVNSNNNLNPSNGYAAAGASEHQGAAVRKESKKEVVEQGHLERVGLGAEQSLGATTAMQDQVGRQQGGGSVISQLSQQREKTPKNATNTTGFFVPYHLQDLGKMNFTNNVVNQSLEYEGQGRGRTGATSFSTNVGAYRLSAEHSAQVRSETTKRISSAQRAKERESFGRLFQMTSDHYKSKQ